MLLDKRFNFHIGETSQDKENSAVPYSEIMKD
jgi:hypothetical protein